MQDLFRKAHDDDVPAFADFPNAPEDVNDWLERQLTGPAKESLIRAAIEVMNASPRQPVWVTTWASFERNALGPKGKETPERWLEAVGLYRGDAPHWLIVLRYRAREAGTLVRPCMLDSGWAYFFPSPPPSTSGHPMDLRIAPCPTHLFAEFLHQQITHRFEHWHPLGGEGFVGKTATPSVKALDRQRDNHLTLLDGRYAPGVVTTWMPDSL